MKTENKSTRQVRHKNGSCKFTVTITTHEVIQLRHNTVSSGQNGVAAFIRGIIHEAVWKEPLSPEDYEAIAKMCKEQENI